MDLVALPTRRYHSPGNRLERLSGDREGQYSIRINDAMTRVFRWKDGDAHDVEIVDYHQDEAMARKRLAPVTFGEVLLEEFLKALGTTQYRVAKDIGVPPRRINELVQGKRAVTADTAPRLARYFGTSERLWLNLQTRHDLEAEKARLGHRLQKEVRVFAAAK